MIPDGIKTQANDDVNSALFDKKHLKLGVESLKQIINNEDTVRHLKF
jgi:AMP nucleosidase